MVKDAEEKREIVLSVYFTEAEFSVLKKASYLISLPISSFVRSSCIRQSKKICGEEIQEVLLNAEE